MFSEDEPCCSESEALRILEQFKTIYETRICEVETDAEASDAHRNELKLKIMTDWVKDLEEQNTLLVQTVHDLEQAAVDRVKLLENNLQKTSTLLSQNMSHPDKPGEDLNILSNRVCELVNDQDCMQKKIEFLQNDIDSLLELIKRGRIENNWDLEGIKFYEIQPSDIPILADCTCAQEKGVSEYNIYIEQLEDREKKLVSYQNELEDRILELNKQIDVKDNLIKRYVTEIKKLRDSLSNKTCKNMRNLSDSISSSNNCSISSELSREKDLEIEKLREQLHNTEEKANRMMHEYCTRVDELERNIACVEKDFSESRDVLAQEVAHKHDVITNLKTEIEKLEEQLKESKCVLSFKNGVIDKLRLEVKLAREISDKAPRNVRKVRISEDCCQNSENESAEERLDKTEKQLRECKSLLELKDREIIELQRILEEKSNQTVNSECENLSSTISKENQDEIVACLTNLIASTKREKEIILNLQIEYETVLKHAKHAEHIYRRDIDLANEKVLDMAADLEDYRNRLFNSEEDKCNMKEFISIFETKMSFLQKLFQNKCEMCAKENLDLKLKDIISLVTSGMKALSEMYESKMKTASSITKLISAHHESCNKNSIRSDEQEAAFAAILKQFRMMEEFRICTVEVQAATEDLREEMSEVVSNLNSQHCRYIELSKTICQVQDYLLRTRENITEVINRLELQDEEVIRLSERLMNSRLRLKDMKNEVNQSQLELSKRLNNVQNNSQQNNLFGCTEINLCNESLISVIDEVELLVSNLQTFQTQRWSTFTTTTEFKKQLTVMEHNVKELKRKSDEVLLENEAAQKLLAERSKLLEKYECEVDNCHTKMQDALESIVDIRDQMNEFGCIRDSDDSCQSTNETITMKCELRKLQKECEELKIKLFEESHVDKKNRPDSEWENRVIDLQDQIKILQSEIKCKQETNDFLKGSINALEKELDSARRKAEEYRRSFSSENLELKKKIFELENSLKVQKNAEENLKCLASNETDTKKSQQLSVQTQNRDRHHDAMLINSLQGTHENVPQILKVLQENIYAIRGGLQELDDELRRLISSGSPHVFSYNDSIKAALDILTKHTENIKHCSFEIEKIKAALYSKDKLMENMDEIIRIQKDSITISQTEVEDLHKKLQEKIEAQEKIICECEEEKTELVKQIELQVRTIGHLQEAVVGTKRTIDQMTNKAASDNDNRTRIVRTLNLYLTETQSQYNDCYEEASKQGTLLELQRNAIGALQKKIKFLEFGEFFNIFMLHFIYYVIVFRYKEELKSKTENLVEMKSKINELVYANDCYEKQCNNLRCKCEETSQNLERTRCELANSCKKLSLEKQHEIDILSVQNADLKKQLQVYKLDLDLIEEEMKKMGISDPSVKSFKAELESVRSENKQLQSQVEKYKRIANELKYESECLKRKVYEARSSSNTDSEKNKERIYRLQNEMSIKTEKLKNMSARLAEAESIINGQLQLIGGQETKLSHFDAKLSQYEHLICDLRAHVSSLVSSEKEKHVLLMRLKGDNTLLKNENAILKADNGMLDLRLNETRLLLSQTHCKLEEAEKSYNRVYEDFNKNQDCLLQMAGKRMALVKCSHMNTNLELHDGHFPNSQNEETERKLKEVEEELTEKRAALSKAHADFNTLSTKYETSERSYQRLKDEMMLAEKKLHCLQQKFQNCTDKNGELIRQNKSLEDNNNKCMAELDDIVLQLEDMQSSLVDLRTECDNKARSLDCVSVELERVKISRTEVCEESKYVLDWVRVWMRQQMQMVVVLQNKLSEKQQQLLEISFEKKNLTKTMRRLKRVNRLLTKRLKILRKPVSKQTAAVLNRHSLLSHSMQKSQINQRRDPPNGFSTSQSRLENSEAAFTRFKRESTKQPCYIVDSAEGNSEWFFTLEHVIKEIPRGQIHETVVNDKKVHDDGYQTSASK